MQYIDGLEEARKIVEKMAKDLSVWDTRTLAYLEEIEEQIDELKEKEYVSIEKELNRE